MAAPQAAARGVLGSAVRAAQQAETKHQTAKEFFKEVSDNSGVACSSRAVLFSQHSGVDPTDPLVPN
jgi:hypothetical protein